MILRKRMRTFVGSIALLVTMAVGHSSAALAVDPLGVIFWRLDQEIALAEAMVKESERRANERKNELTQWVGWWESVKTLAQSKQNDLAQNIEQRRKNASLLLGTIRGLTTDAKQKRNVPNFGWHSRETAAALETSLLLEARQLRQAISDGKDNWHMVVAGWITSGALDDRIAGLRAEIQAIGEGVTSGAFKFHSAFGWRTIGSFRDQLKSARASKAKVLKDLADGNYALEIPGIGRVTRKQLEKRLADVQTAIRNLKHSGTIGEYQIHRPSVGWVTRKKLQAQLDEGEKSFEASKKLVSDGLFNVHIAGAGGGWWTRDNLEKKAASLDKMLADIGKAVRAGDYRAQVMGGWHSLNSLTEHIKAREKRLGDPNLNQLQRNQIAEQIEAARKAITEWRTLSALDLTIKGLEKSKFLAWVGFVLKLAKPDFDHRALKRKEQVYHVASFNNELALRLKPLEKERDSYLDGLKWFAHKS